MHETSHPHGSHPVLILAALAGLVCLSLIECSRVHRRRLGENSAAAPERLRTWEAEGGQNQMERRPPEEV